ncbi:MAG: hypothetical protein A2762_04735 [Candidatus Lloydbacteria bacterium RIFCSPHIGHO2_01_FULL_54_11]|nr:MAG: hypothetical protein A2762_04735 [Candidatus Lloydbacteria bacterium RIFCSPHIGHO2_01_FULL_54_11]
MLEHFTSLLDTPAFRVLGQVYDVLYATAFIWGPVLSIWLAQKLWLEYVRADYVHKNFQFVMLEVKLPRVIGKTPVAMELVLQALYQPDKTNWYERWWKGEVVPWFSLELVSIEGAVKFFIRTPSKYKKLIESNIYAQYPDIEVHEVEDYVSLAPYLGAEESWGIWGCHFKLTKPDPYPIRTYVDYGLDSTLTDEENKSDPMTSLIEFLGTLGRGQQMWIQIIVQVTARRFKKTGSWFGMQDWEAEGKKLIQDLQDEYAGETGMRATKRQAEIIHAIERSLGKVGFDTGIRALNIAKGDKFDSANKSGITNAFQQYSTQDLNGFRPTNSTGFDYPWQDFRGIRMRIKKRKFYDAYVRRSWFHPPYKRKPFILNAEELATIYHFPGGVAETPTFTRIESRKGEPPANLPV